ncbi:Membrane protein YdfJ [Corynebacterium endometrii]|uniref:Membrane protein YdfJ n=1 Tax=Corynebacterium endometrii TaxID=2488819 RepID=A0A4P7QDN5_9CORY|nr:Membrane protein YdfJ [Corynebacterium endometrii]
MVAKFLFRLGRWSFLNKWKVIIGWIVLLAAMGGATAALMKPMTQEFSISGTPAIDATYRAVELFPEGGNPANSPSVNLTFQAPEGQKLSDPHNEAAIDAVISHLRENLDFGDDLRFGNPLEVSPALQQGVIDQMTGFGLPRETAEADAANLAMVNEDETIAYTTFNFDASSPYTVEQSDKDIVTDAMNIGRAQGLLVEAGGAGFGDVIAVEPLSEIIGLAVAFLVLIFTFGSLVASGMPLLSAVIGVGLGALGMLAMTHWFELNNITPVLAVMIGLAVGIDYALFILSRYRAEREARPGPEAAGMAVGTAGSSVVFAGATVFIALFALIIANIEFLTAMGLAAAATVAVSVLVALTFVPAMLGALGDKSFAGAVPGVAGNPAKWRKKRSMQGPTMGNRWVRFVQKWPGLTMAAVVLSLGALSTPVLNMELALPADTTSDPDTTQRKAADTLSEGFGPGINGPFLVIVDGQAADPNAAALAPLIEAQAEGSGQDKATFSSFMYAADQLNTVGGVKRAQLVGVNSEGTAAQIMVTPETSPTDAATVKVAAALRETNAQIEDATGAELGMTGLTAVQLDITERLEGAMPLYLSIVVGLAIVLLLLVFRSILVPVVAGLGFLLSVGAAFGVTVLVWQEGFTGLVPAPGPLISFMPIFLIGVTFGLAMDYQVFLVTRMREYYSRMGGRASAGSPYNAVDESTIVGFTQGARVVTAAAIIMISVFVAFIGQPLPFIKIFGFALAAAVLFDAFFVRMALVPATMFLMGRATWWMPRWLDKVLPELDVEGTALEEQYGSGHQSVQAEERVGAHAR